jgi:transposase-like protein
VRIGEASSMTFEEYAGMAVDTQAELIRALVPLGLLEIGRQLDEEVRRLAGRRYQHGDGEAGVYRHGRNPGSVVLGGQRIPIRVPRVRGPEGEIALKSYERFQRPVDPDDLLLRRVLWGLSCRNYREAAGAVPGAIGLSASTVSRQFIEASAQQLKDFQERDLSELDVLVVFLDGKTFAEDQMILALGVLENGEKRILGFAQTDTENERVVSGFLRGLLARGLDRSKGLLFVIDGSKGLRAAIREVFKDFAVVQRCQWHKRENVVSYLPKTEQASWRRRLQHAYERPTLAEATKDLNKIHRDLSEINESAAASLLEGLDETLTLHKLGIFALLGRALKTTNCIESVNALAETRCGKVDRWKNSNQKHRWFATALLDIEPRLRRLKGYRQLRQLREALAEQLNLETRKRANPKQRTSRTREAGDAA